MRSSTVANGEAESSPRRVSAKTDWREPAPAPAWNAGRIDSVDVLRGVVITLMIFVNDLAGAAHTPTWLEHASEGADAMTLADFVLPAFLFIAGMTVPLALERAKARGASTGQLLRKVALRTAALLTIGLLVVNTDDYNPWHRGAWGMLAYASMLLAFAVVPRTPGRARNGWRTARAVGWFGLLTLALAYKTQPTPADPVAHHLVLGPLFDARDTAWLRTSWWGILGIIGCAYFLTAIAYLAIGRRREWLVGAMTLQTYLYVASSSDYASRLANREWLHWARPAIQSASAVVQSLYARIPIGECMGSMAAVAMAGCCLGSILVPGSDIRSTRQRLRWAAGFAGGLAAGAVLLDSPYGLNKSHATPAFCLLGAAATAAGWILLHGSMEIRGHLAWSRLVAPAGANPLLAYLLYPFVYLVAAFLAVPIDFYHHPQWPRAVAIGGSLVMALLVVQLTGLLGRLGYRLKA